MEKKLDYRRLIERRVNLGFTQKALGAEIGMSQQAVVKMEKGMVNRPRKLKELATALRVSEDWLLGNSVEMGVDPEIKILGTVKAGVFTTPETYEEPTAKTLEHKISGPRYALKIQDESMNKTVLPGYYAICTNYLNLPAGPQSGDIVIAESLRNGLIETTIKRLKYTSNGTAELLSESNNEKYQRAIVVEGSDTTVLIKARVWYFVSEVS